MVQPTRSSEDSRVAEGFKKLGEDVQNYRRLERFFHRTVKVELIPSQARTPNQSFLSWLFGSSISTFRKNSSRKRYLHLDRGKAIVWLKDRGVTVTGKEDLSKLITKTVHRDIFSLQIAQNYERILEKQTRLNPGAIDAGTLKKVVQAAFENKTIGFGCGLAFEITHEKVQKKVLAGFREEKLYLRDITQPKEIGKGSFAVVEEVKSITSGKLKAVKWAKSRDIRNYNIARNEIRKEHLILRKLHEVEKIPGIQKPSSSFVHLNPTSKNLGILSVGTLTYKYDGNLQEAIKSKKFPNLQTKIQSFTPLLEGMTYCADKMLLHGDIKPDNILFEETEGNEIKLYVGDFGGSLIADDRQNTWETIPTYTPLYTPFKDQQSISKAFKEHDFSLFVELNQKRDVFSLGCTLANLLTGKDMVMSSYTEQGFPDKRAVLREDLFEGIPKELVSFVKKMTDSDHRRRPSMKEALAEWNLLSLKYANGHEEDFASRPIAKKPAAKKGIFFVGNAAGLARYTARNNKHLILRKLHGAGEIPGIQKPPRSALTYKYDGNLQEAIKSKKFPNLQTKIQSFTPLLEGMTYCADKMLLHGDIKPDNILFEETKENEIKLYVGDFGGSLIADDRQNTWETIPTYTPLYTPLKDHKLLSKAFKEHDFSLFVEINQKRDVFSLGCTLANLLTGEDRVMSSYTEQGFPDKRALLREDLFEGIPKELVSFVKKMTDSDHRRRPSMKEALAEWNLLSLKYANGYEEDFASRPIAKKPTAKKEKATIKIPNPRPEEIKEKSHKDVKPSTKKNSKVSPPKKPSRGRIVKIDENYLRDIRKKRNNEERATFIPRSPRKRNV